MGHDRQGVLLCTGEGGEINAARFTVTLGFLVLASPTHWKPKFRWTQRKDRVDLKLSNSIPSGPLKCLLVASSSFPFFRVAVICLCVLFVCLFRVGRMSRFVAAVVGFFLVRFCV